MFLLTLATAARAETLDFAQAVQRALAQNPDIIVAGTQISQAQAAVRQSTGARMPKLTASLNVTRTDDALNAFGIKLSQRNATFNDFGAAEFNPANPSVLSVAPQDLNHPGWVNNFNTRLEAQLPLYSGGMIEGYAEQAKAHLRAARQGDVMARQQVIFDVLRAYEGVHAARAYRDVATQGRLAAENHVKTINSLFKQGVAVKSDLLTAQVHLEDVKVQQTQAENAVQQALDQLHLLLGMPLAAPLDVAGSVEVPPLEGKLADHQDDALKSNPGLAALRGQLDAAQAAVKVARAGKYPQAGLMARFDTNDPNPGFEAHSYTVGGQLSWQLFDGGVNDAAIHRAQASLDELVAKLNKAENGVAYQVVDAWRRADEAQRRVAARELAVSQAEEAQRIVGKRYAGGVTTITELLAGQAQLDKTRADLVAARYELKVQRANARLATGRLQPDLL
ncbi:MAG: transporter [Hydrogenophilales bacterium RIFOXYD1_FULL_62_11]|nr:MAG: transporter [Hydrogenophilales bacterium RIFOXYD1_FULL_62_11]